MPVKLYPPREVSVRDAPEPPRPGAPLVWRPPPPPPEPFADSEADFRVVLGQGQQGQTLPSVRPGLGNWPGMEDPRPQPVSASEGTMQRDVEGFESRWSREAPVEQLPFKVTR